eukprot:2426555-Pyramimonas_sp.AAC.1
MGKIAMGVVRVAREDGDFCFMETSSSLKRSRPELDGGRRVPPPAGQRQDRPMGRGARSRTWRPELTAHVAGR